MKGKKKRLALAFGLAVAAVGAVSAAAFTGDESAGGRPSAPTTAVDAGSAQDSPEDIREFWTEKRMDQAEPQ